MNVAKHGLKYTARLAVGLMFTVTTTTLAQPYDAELSEAFLVPVSVRDAPGAFGSRWSTDLWYRNNSNHPVTIFGLASSDRFPTIGVTERLFIFARSGDSPGSFLILSKAGSNDVQFDLRLFNSSDPADTVGTKLPVVRASNFREEIHLINVPTTFDVRSALRVYVHPNDTAAAGDSVTVTVFGNDEGLLASAEVPLRGQTRYGAILSLVDAFPQTARMDRIRVRVESRNRARIWAFVTTVSNVTQRVSIVTPD
jgi:hypothetical protein